MSNLLKHSGIVAVATLLAAQGATTRAMETTGEQAAKIMEVVVVTGTRGSPRTVFDSMSPIDVISDESLKLTASDELMDSLAQLVPSFNVQRLPIADGSIFVRPARLRNLSADHTLVLVNGKRRHRSALLMPFSANGAQSADLAQIASLGIKQVEVLRDGASAIYGSEAIAGVINVIMDDSTETDAFIQYGEYKAGDGQQLRAGVKSGIEWDDGFINGSFEYSTSDPTSRSRQRPDALAFAAANPSVVVRDPVQNWGQPERTSNRTGFNAAHNFGAVEGYAFGAYNWGTGVSDFNWRNPATSNAYASSAAYPAFDLRDIYPGGFSPQFGQDDTDISLYAGLRGEFGNDFTYDGSIGYGENQIEYFMSESINASLGSDSPTSFKPGTLTQREVIANLDFTHPVGIATVAFGLEARQETYIIGTGDPASYAVGPAAPEGLPANSNGFPGFRPDTSGTFDQTSYGAYADVDIPVSEQLSMALAGRFENYSEFGSSTDFKVSSRYELADNIAVRATVASGFKAPTPGQLFSESLFQFLDVTSLDIITGGRYSPQGPIADIINARADADVSALKPEESMSYTLGLVWDSSSAVTTTLDFYRIKVEGRFGASQSYFPTASEKIAFAASGVQGGENILLVNFFQNDFDTVTNGFDVVATYPLNVGNGLTTFTGAYNYNKTEVVGGTLALDEAARVRFEEILPRQRATLSANYAAGNLALLARYRYVGSWTDYSDGANGATFQKFGAEGFVDLSASYDLSETITVRLAAENIFDSYPAEATFQSNRGLIYSRNSPYDTDGAYYYMRIDATL
ncbi:MAG: TonB-dependent receptor [Pseudomonadales bacterium]|nr:TonB-dependent receptor [Pseudomonadales bacterium]